MPTETVPVRTRTFPKAVPFIIGNEAAERFSFYGMLSILPTFLVAQFFNPHHLPGLQIRAEAQANDQIHSFMALAYVLPVVGAVLADWVFGKYRFILGISLLYCVGHALLATFDADLSGFRYGLLLVAVGMGGIKSCVAANVGDQFDRSNEDLLPKVYSWFVFTISFGSVTGTLVIPYLYARFGPSVAFGVPGLLMALATFTFWLGRNRYVRVAPLGFAKGFRQTFRRGEGLSAIGRLLLVFAFVPLFWALNLLSMSEWILQAAKMDCQLWPGFRMQPEQVQSIGSFFEFTLIPVFAYGIYPGLTRLGVRLTPLRKIGAGMVMTGLSCVVIAGLQARLDAGSHPSIWWQVLAYFVLATGTVQVAVTGLEYAYTHSPKALKSVMTALWFLMVAAANLLLARVNGSIASDGFFSRFQGASFYWFFASLMAVNIVLFVFVASFVKEKTYVGVVG